MQRKLPYSVQLLRFGYGMIFTSVIACQAYIIHDKNHINETLFRLENLRQNDMEKHIMNHERYENSPFDIEISELEGALRNQANQDLILDVIFYVMLPISIFVAREVSFYNY